MRPRRRDPDLDVLRARLAALTLAWQETAADLHAATLAPWYTPDRRALMDATARTLMDAATQLTALTKETP